MGRIASLFLGYRVYVIPAASITAASRKNGTISYTKVFHEFQRFGSQP